MSKQKVKTQRISKKKAVEVLEATAGRFFTVEFKKKNGDLRVMNCQKVAGATVTKLGYLTVREAVLARSGQSAIRRLNMQTLKTIKTGGKLYKIRS